MTFSIESVRFHVLPMRTRFPFQYGIASMSALPHLFVTAEMSVAGKAVRGLASEGLPPKWFTKDPATAYEQDLAEMLAVIQNAARIGRHAAARPIGYFAWWRDLYDEQQRWSSLRHLPSLLANLGVSLLERAVLDGLCRAAGTPIHQLLRSDALGVDLGNLRAELRGLDTARALADPPCAHLAVRHTVGLGDPLRAAELAPSERLDDGLPQALDESIRAYGLDHFKIKIRGHRETDLPRLQAITRVLTENCPDGFRVTLDGNEQFTSMAEFRDYHAALQSDRALAPLLDRLLFVEQPLHRDQALDDEVAAVFAGWPDRPALIIDEADADLDSLPRALALGYRGTSHKNCKGIVKGLANAALIRLRTERTGRPHVLSGEDLANVGPVALLQDCAMAAALGLDHVERNGHHYFRGLSAHREELQAAVLAAHPDLYERHARGFASLRIRSGRLQLDSVNAAPFGCGLSLDTEAFQPLDGWIKQGGLAVL